MRCSHGFLPGLCEVRSCQHFRGRGVVADRDSLCSRCGLPIVAGTRVALTRSERPNRWVHRDCAPRTPKSDQLSLFGRRRP